MNINGRDIDTTGGYKPSTPASAPVTASSIAANVTKNNLDNDPEAKPYDPSVDWDSEHWAGSGAAAPTPTPTPVRKPIIAPVNPVRPVGGPRIGGSDAITRVFPNYGQSFAARSGANSGSPTSTIDENPERFAGEDD